jgi:hypothetical protein
VIVINLQTDLVIKRKILIGEIIKERNVFENGKKCSCGVNIKNKERRKEISIIITKNYKLKKDKRKTLLFEGFNFLFLIIFN